MRPAVSYAALAAALAFALPAAAVQRAFVASYGSDANTANNCAFTTPCRGFQAAHGVTDSGGEVIALDAAGYGVITITKSISLIANSGFYAGIAVGSGVGITIDTPNVSVVLRGLNINGTPGAGVGVNMTDGATLTIENCVFSNFTSGGAINVSVPAQVRITNTTVRDNQDGIRIGNGANASVSQMKIFGNSGTGIFAVSSSAGTTSLAITDSTVSNNGVGIKAITNFNAGAIAHVSVTRTTASNNVDGVMVIADGAGSPSMSIIDSMFTHNSAIGLNNVNALLESFGRNLVRYNGQDTLGTITTVPAM